MVISFYFIKIYPVRICVNPPMGSFFYLLILYTIYVYLSNYISEALLFNKYPLFRRGDARLHVGFQKK